MPHGVPPNHARDAFIAGSTPSVVRPRTDLTRPRKVLVSRACIEDWVGHVDEPGQPAVQGSSRLHLGQRPLVMTEVRFL